jgi:predicted ABC-type transport system involved in lysophospholipase L1 biosynthesis ATPase subunit
VLSGQKTLVIFRVMKFDGSVTYQFINFGLLDRLSFGSSRIQGTETTSLNDRELTHLRGHQIGFICHAQPFAVSPV